MNPDDTPDQLFDTAPLTVEALDQPNLSYGRRLTILAHLAIENDRHPANGLPIDKAHTCGDCGNLNRYHYHNRIYTKCPKHRLGESHSEASDIRCGWPACPHWTAITD